MLYISALLASKRFRDKGHKEGAVKAITMLQEAGIGRVIEDKPPRGATVVSCINFDKFNVTVKFYYYNQFHVQTYQYRKPSVPDDTEGREQLASKLLAFGVSLKEFTETLSPEEITP